MLAFAAGLAILGLFIHKALAPENREKLETLWKAPPGYIAFTALMGLFTHQPGPQRGGTFWALLLPVRRLPMLDVQATNAVATLLAYLPMKLSAVSRFVIHNRRDHVPLMTIGAWMGASGVCLLASIGPPVAAAFWRRHIDGPFLCAMLGGMALTYTLTLVLSRIFAHAKGLARLHRLTDPLGFNWLNRMMHAAWFHNFHAGFAMLAHPWTLLATRAMRTADVMLQASRFALAAKVVGVDLSWEGAILIATTFFMIGVLSPAGNLGTREGGATGVAALVPGLSTSGFIVVALVVSASEMVVNAIFGTIGLVWLRPRPSPSAVRRPPTHLPPSPNSGAP